jgi:phosphoserine aminotransferase
MLPTPVLLRAQAEMLDYRGTGIGIMEMSHRTPPFEELLAEAEADLRALLSIPTGYRVLFLQGGATHQFGMVPLAFLGSDGRGQYVVTGAWGAKAVEAARIVSSDVSVPWDGGERNYRDLPTALPSGEDATYLHLTSNETIQGVQFPSDPDTDLPVVCDMSSDILSRPIDVSRYSLIYAGAQKNMGPAGLTVVIVSDALLSRHREGLPPMLDYRVHVKNNSLYNTPPCWSIYVTGLVLRHLRETGGVEAAQARNETKAAVLYEAIDNSGGFYRGHAAPEARSNMNVSFFLADDSLTKRFVEEAKAEGMPGLKGHRMIGGIRASIYNAFPLEGCEYLRDFMREFAHRHG